MDHGLSPIQTKKNNSREHGFATPPDSSPYDTMNCAWPWHYITQASFAWCWEQLRSYAHIAHRCAYARLANGQNQRRAQAPLYQTTSRQLYTRKCYKELFQRADLFLNNHPLHIVENEKKLCSPEVKI